MFTQNLKDDNIISNIIYTAFNEEIIKLRITNYKLYPLLKKSKFALNFIGDQDFPISWGDGQRVLR